MKKIFIKPLLLLVVLSGIITGCTKDDDYNVPTLRTPFFSEEFSVAPVTVLNLPGWTNFAEKGTIKWSSKTFDGNGYAQFNTFGGTDAVNVGWLISPSIDISGKENVKFSFQSAQNFVTDPANTTEAYVSTDFDGTNVLGATWTKVDAKFANKDTTGYLFVPSGSIDLTPYQEAGHVYIAFKTTGSGSNTALDGLFQIDNLYVYTSK